MSHTKNQEKLSRGYDNYQKPIGSIACNNCVLNNYQEFCETHDIDGDESTMMQFFALGLASEAGEVAGDIMKHYVYAPERASRDTIIKEVGDSLWYAANILTQLDSSFSEAMMVNIGKLSERYPERFDRAKEVNDDKSTIEKELERLLTFRNCVTTNDAEKAEIDNRIEGLLIIDNG